jgi:hypothetical protein
MRLSIKMALPLVIAIALLASMLTQGISAQQPEGNYWTEKTSMQQARVGLSAAAADGKIYAIGGDAHDGVTNVNEEYNPATDTWSYKSPMPTPRYGFGIAVYNNKIYCFGGKASLGVYAINVVEVYDTLSDTWKTLPSMPTAKMSLQTAVVGDKIYLLGGRNTDIAIGNQTNYTTVEAFSPKTGNWEMASPIPQIGSEYITFASSIGNDIYAITKTHNMIFNTQSKTWREAASPPNAPYLGCINAGILAPQHIYVFGTNKTIDNYDPATDIWTSNPSNASLNYYAAIASLNDRFYVLGGFFLRPTDYSRDGPSVNKFQEQYSGANMEYTPTDYGIRTLPSPTVPEFSWFTILPILLAIPIALAAVGKRLQRNVSHKHY